jgi:CheY-like chemotaxis protein
LNQSWLDRRILFWVNIFERTSETVRPHPNEVWSFCSKGEAPHSDPVADAEKFMNTPPKPTVLFLEDDEDTRLLVKFTLEEAGIHVLTAESVSKAWEIALETWRKPVIRGIDLFLLDGLVPHGDSLKLCADLRKIEPTKPIVFYSGLAFKADILRGLEAGATAYLTKPYSGDLAEEILRYISTATDSGVTVSP